MARCCEGTRKTQPRAREKRSRGLRFSDHVSDHVFIAGVGGGQAGESDGVEGGADLRVKAAVDLGNAGGGLRRGQLHVLAEAGERALRRAQDLARGVVRGAVQEAVAAALAVRALDQPGFGKRAQNALEIFLRQLQPLGDLAAGDKTAAVSGQIDHDEQSVAAAGGDQHSAASLAMMPPPRTVSPS